MAKSFGVSPSMLSSVIKGKRKLSKDKALAFAAYTGFSPVECRHFLALYDLEQVLLKESKACLVRFYFDGTVLKEGNSS